MHALLRRLRLSLWSRTGQGIVEYALIVVLVAAVLVTALSTIGRRNPGGNPMQSVAETLGEVT